MALPLWVFGGGMALAKGLSKVFGHKAENAQAKAAKAADDERVKAAQSNRVARTGMAASILKGLQSSLGAGASSYRGSAAPNYQIDPQALAALQAAPAATHAPDPTKGQGWSFAGDLAGGVGNAIGTYLTGGLNKAFGSQWTPTTTGDTTCPPDCE